MLGVTHVNIGVAIGFGVALLYNATPAEAVTLATVSGIAALLPDIDHPQSRARKRLGVVGNLLFDWLPHRGLTHTLLALFLVAFVTGLFFPAFALGATLGYGSHLIADMVTRAGLPLLYPVTERKLYFMPRGLRLRTGAAETRLNFLVVALSAFMYISLLS